jgi:hypothetical protein
VKLKPVLAALVTSVTALTPAPSAIADTLNCSLAEYKTVPGLVAAVDAESLVVTWDGERNQELRLRLAINAGAPMIRELEVRRRGGKWTSLAVNVTPEFRVVSGRRRMDDEAATGLEENGIHEITPEVFERYQWDPFWDAPLNIPGNEGNLSQRTLGLPRTPDEVKRATATYRAQGCEVKADGARIDVTFPGVTLGVFAGQLQFTVYKGTNLIRQQVIAKTEQNSVAYKYDAGLRGLPIQNGSRLVWRDTAKNPQSYALGGAKNDQEAPLKTSNRLVIAELGNHGSIGAFPPPHNFFWARESAFNLGYNWYRKDGDTSFSFGIRQAENEEELRIRGNFALYSARPGTWQYMPVFFYVSAEPAEATREAVLAFTHGDHYKPLPGYQVMSHHYHMGLGQRLTAANNADAEIVDLAALKALGLNIVSPIDNVGNGPGSGGRPAADTLKMHKFQIDGARRHSDNDFLVMPNHEFYGSVLGGHTDLLYSHPVYWVYGRKAGQPLVEEIAPYGKVYNIGAPDDLVEMVKRENAIMSMPHPRTKNNTGFPDGFKDKGYFKDPRFQGVGFRWGMGVDRSERRLCEYRCLALLDDMSNWFADLPAPPKYIMAISEVQTQTPNDEIYSSAPVNYLKLDSLPTPDDASSVIQTLARGDYFVTSGEVLIPSYSVQGTGAQRKIVADLEWTFPLDFVEVVWGDGQRTDRQIISATDLPAFGKKRFEIPFDGTGKKWVRFAVWDTAGNGALVQPVKLNVSAATSQ